MVLRAVVFFAGALGAGEGAAVELEDLPDEIRRAVPRASIGDGGAVRPLADVEKDYILAALHRNGGNQTRTALQLGIGSATLYRKLKRYGLIASRVAASAPEHLS